ncbi:MAG: hypothetical protein EBU32_01605 [Opitutaceae bacterium]|jgi:hypothetical protein|nr:hypothetical protein [Opitutaceae bacterium]
MLVCFTKNTPSDSADALTCLRKDGTRAKGEMPKQAILPNAAFHFVIETTLAWRDGFFGQIADGADFASVTAKFQTAKKSPAKIPRLRQIEALVACLAAEQWGGASEPAAFAVKLAAACKKERVPTLALTPDELTRVRVTLREFGAAWRPLTPGQTLERKF